MKILGKVSKYGMDSIVTPNKKKRKRRRPITPEEIDHFENKIKRHNRVLLDSFGLTTVEWSEEEIKQQQRELDNKAIKQDISRKIEIEKKKSKLFCSCKQHVRKDGYWVCVECGIKKRKVGTSK